MNHHLNHYFQILDQSYLRTDVENYIRELRKSTTLEIKNIKNELIKIKNKSINRNKKEVRDYYQESKFYGLKD